MGFDGAFNYKTTQDYVAKLKSFVPRVSACYFDNVGGSVTDAVLPVLNVRGTDFQVSGQISQYNA